MKRTRGWESEGESVGGSQMMVRSLRGKGGEYSFHRCVPKKSFHDLLELKRKKEVIL